MLEPDPGSVGNASRRHQDVGAVDLALPRGRPHVKSDLTSGSAVDLGDLGRHEM
jgi:hypothetical protein